MWDRQLAKRIKARVAAAHAEMKKKKRRFLGRDAVMRESFARRAATREGRPVPIPKVAASDPNTKEGELFVRKQFLVEHRLAKVRWCAGDRGVVFPYGTW